MSSMVRLLYQLKSVLKSRETMLKNSIVVLFVSPYTVGQAGNFWTLLRIYDYLVVTVQLGTKILSTKKDFLALTTN